MRISKSFVAAFSVCAMTVLASADGQDQQRGDQAQPRTRTEVQQLGQQDDRTNQRTSQGQGTSIKEAIVQKLILANEAEIELAQMAQQKSKNKEITQFAQTMISDHQQLNEKLRSMAGTQGNSQGSEGLGNSTRGNQGLNNQRDNAQGRNDDQQSGVRNVVTNDPRGDQTTGQQSDRQGNARGGDRGHMGRGTVPSAMVSIMEQACKNSLQMTKEMLQEKDGSEFDMAFVGQQMVAHMNLLAELKAIQSQGPQDLKEVMSTAAKKTEGHLEQLKQIAKQLKDNQTETRS